MGSSSRIEFMTYEQAYGRSFDDMLRRVPNLKKIDTAIGFRPRHSLDQIIDAVIADKRAIARLIGRGRHAGGGADSRQGGCS